MLPSEYFIESRALGSSFVRLFSLLFLVSFFLCFYRAPCVIRDNKIFGHVYLTKIHFFLLFFHRIARAIANFSYARSTGKSSSCAHKDVSIKQIKVRRTTHTHTHAELSCDFSRIQSILECTSNFK